MNIFNKKNKNNKQKNLVLKTEDTLDQNNQQVSQQEELLQISNNELVSQSNHSKTDYSIQELQNMNEQLNQHHDLFDDSIESFIFQSHKNMFQNNIFNYEMSQLNIEKQSLIEMNQILQKQVMEQAIQIDSLNQQIQEKNKNIQDDEQNLQVILQIKSQIQAEFITQSENIQNHKILLENQEKKLSILENQNYEQKNQIQQLELTREQLNSNNSEIKNTFQQKINDLNIIIQNQDQISQEQSQNNQKLSSANDNLINTQQELQQQTIVLNQSNEDYKQKNLDLKDKLSQKEELTIVLIDQNDKLQKQVEFLQTSFQNEQIKSEELFLQLTQLKEIKNTQQIEITNLKQYKFEQALKLTSLVQRISKRNQMLKTNKVRSINAEQKIDSNSKQIYEQIIQIQYDFLDFFQKNECLNKFEHQSQFQDFYSKIKNFYYEFFFNSIELNNEENFLTQLTKVHLSLQDKNVEKEINAYFQDSVHFLIRFYN